MTTAIKAVIAVVASMVVITTALIAFAAVPAQAQRYPDRDGGRVIDWLDRLTRDTGNEPLNCTITKRLDRRGDIILLRMECRGYDRRR